MLDDFLKSRTMEIIGEDDNEEDIGAIVLECKNLFEQSEFEVIETDFRTKSRIDYLFTLKP